MESIARDYSHSLPKLGCIIPPYKAWRDSHAAAYFTTKPVPPLLQRTGQANGGTSGYGKMAECFQFSSAAALYLILRNKAGAGHSATLVGGHQLFLTSVKPLVGYNGTYGYRRNTPSLRRQPSLFRLVGNLPIH